MFHSTRRFLNTSMAVLVVLALMLGFVSPVFAEGEVPEDAPPVAAPVGGDTSPETLEQALSDGSAAVADGGAMVPLASQSVLDVPCVPDPWFYGALCDGGVCRGLLPGEDGFETIQLALDDWLAKKGVGYIYLEGDYNQAESLSITDAVKYSTLKGIVWDGSSGIPQLTGNLTVENLLAGFLLQGFAIIDGEVTFANNKGLVKLQNMTLDQVDHDGYGLNIYNHAGPVTLSQVRVANARNFGVYVNNSYPAGAATGAVTVSNLTILNTWADSGEGSDWYGGLYIESNSPISINGLFIKETVGGGALIQPGLGAVTVKNGYVGFSHYFSDTYNGFGLKISGGLSPVGTITLDNLRIYDNQSDGILIANAGVVKLNNVFSSGNYGGYGLHIGDSDYGYAATSLTITNSQFNGNNFGNSVVIRGPVSISNTEISGNGNEFSDATGLYLDNTALSGAPVVLSGVSANDNTQNGLKITTRGSATLTNIEAYNNQVAGMEVDSSDGLGNVTINTSIFNDNKSIGLSVKSKKNITLKLVEASNNWGLGAWLDNQSGTGSVTLLGLGTSGNNFHRNHDTGLWITSAGTVTITNISTDGNSGSGVYIDNTDGMGGVSVLSASPAWMNYFTRNEGFAGLEIYSKGSIKLVNVSAWDNEVYGVYLDNCQSNGVGCTGTGSVTISSLGTSGNNFHWNNSDGLFIISEGTVTITNIFTDSNGGSGVYIDNTDGIGGVSILAASPYWMNSFTWNRGSAGLEIYSKGSIKLVNVSAWDNEVYGVYLDNCQSNGVGCTGTGSVTISSLGTGMVNAFNNNNTAPDLDDFPYSGLYVTSFGSISLTNVEASRNGKSGIRLYNNYQNSLGIYSAGNITVNNLTSRDISDNGFIGISALSYGNISIKGVNANNNYIRGGQVGNWGAPIARTITISNSSFNGSRNDRGLIIVHNGKVTLSSVSANWNDVVDGGIGLWESVREKISWNNQGQPDTWTYTGIAETTTVAGWFGFDSREFTPVLTVLDYGTFESPLDPPVLVYDSNDPGYNWEDGYFWFDTEEGHQYKFNIAGDTADYSGRYTFELYEYENSGDGTPVDFGKVFQNDGLGGSGIYIDNTYGTAGVTVTNPAASRAEVNGNSGDGLFIRSNGTVTVNNLNAYDNGNAGVSVTTNYDNSVIPATVNLSGLVTNWNGGHGVGVQTLGSIVYSASTSGGNGYYAAYLDNCLSYDGENCLATVMKPVTLTKLNFDNNAFGPAVVRSFGNITAGGITSRYNGGSGLMLKNDFTGSTGTVTLLGTLGQNVFEGNKLAGMRIYSNGNVTLSNFVVRNNGKDYNPEADDPEALSAGMYISAGGKILLSSGTVTENNRNGILIDSYNSVSMSKMLVMMNGWDGDLNGIEIYAHGVSPVSITSSLIFGNAKHGLAIIDGVGDPTLTGTIFFGNDLDMTGDADVEY